MWPRSGVAAADPHRLALVIGNAHYRHAPVLDNAANDANAIAAVLKRMDFDVVDVVDADRADLQTALAFGVSKAIPAIQAKGWDHVDVH